MAAKSIKYLNRFEVRKDVSNDEEEQNSVMKFELCIDMNFIGKLRF